MNGPEHYRAAQGLIQEAHATVDPCKPRGYLHGISNYRHGRAERTVLLAEAQAHATLALAAATAAAQATAYDGNDRSREWAGVL